MLERARSVGFLGPGPIEDHVEHAGRFAEALMATEPTSWIGLGRGADGADTGAGAGTGRTDRAEPAAPDGAGSDAGLEFADLGAGGGVPSLPILVAHPDLRAVLIDAAQKRCSFLVWAVGELGLSDRVEVWCGRAEEIAHQTRARHRFDAVVARSFGPPAVTLECAAGLVRLGGRIIVSEPPLPRPWPADGLALLGLAAAETQPPGVAVFRRVGDLPAGWPRPMKQQRRGPAFEAG